MSRSGMCHFKRKVSPGVMIYDRATNVTADTASSRLPCLICVAPSDFPAWIVHWNNPRLGEGKLIFAPPALL